MKLIAFDGGSCRQCLGFIDRRSWRWVRFHAVFWAFEHATAGWVLIDAGYGGRFREATHHWPYRLYRYVTPARMNGRASDALKAAGIEPEKIAHVIVTHFHADHIGGLAEFPQAIIHYREDALSKLASLSPWRQVKAAFLPRLIPAWLASRSSALSAAQFTENDQCELGTYDLFGDGTVHLVNLPGHAPGQIGVWWPQAQTCYVADAFWREIQLETNRSLLGPARSLQCDPVAYEQTLEKLKRWRARSGVRLIACHSLSAETALSIRPCV